MEKGTKFLASVELVVIIASLCGNVYQYNAARQLEQQLADSNTAIESLQSKNADLEKQIADATAELETLKSNVTALIAQIDESTAEKDALQSELSELQAKAEQKQKEEEEAAKKAVEVAKTTTSVKISTPVEDSYELTEEQNEAALQYAAEQLGATIIYVDNNAPISDGIEGGHQLR